MPNETALIVRNIVMVKICFIFIILLWWVPFLGIRFCKNSMHQAQASFQDEDRDEKYPGPLSLILSLTIGCNFAPCPNYARA